MIFNKNFALDLIVAVVADYDDVKVSILKSIAIVVVTVAIKYCFGCSEQQYQLFPV